MIERLAKISASLLLIGAGALGGWCAVSTTGCLVFLGLCAIGIIVVVWRA